METIKLREINRVKQLANTDTSLTYLTQDGSVLKIFKPIYHLVYKGSNTSLEDKIMNARFIKDVPEIVVPKKAVFEEDMFVGYLTNYVGGINYNDLYDNMSIIKQSDLRNHADIYSKIEGIVKRGNENGIMFPDLCNCDNIILGKYKNFKMIDYDGLQINNYQAVSMSTSLGNQKQYYIPKYQKDGLWTANLDKKSLIYLYFVSAFNVNLKMIGEYNPITKKNITLDDFFDIIGLEDLDVKHKVWKCFQNNIDNDYLGEDVYRIAENYNMIAYPYNGSYLKKLIKK